MRKEIVISIIYTYGRCNFIVTLYGAYYDQGKVKIILELMDAGSLENIISAYSTAEI